MHNNQWITFSAILCITFAAVLVSGGGGGGGGSDSHEHGHGHGGGGVGQPECQNARQFFTQWWPQSALISAFQTACRQVGAVQAWAILQNLLGVPATGVLDQATFQALLNNANHALLAQQLLTLLPTYPVVGK